MSEKEKLLGGPVGMGMQEEVADPRLLRLAEYKVLKIRQKPRGWCCELIGDCCCCECCCHFENEYHVVSDDKKHHLYEAREHTNCFCLNCCGARRSFEMTFDDAEKGHKHDKSPVMEIERPFRLRCFCCPCDCCRQVIRVKSGREALGTVEEMCWLCVPTLDVRNSHGELRYQLKGDNMCCRCHNIFTWCCRCCPEYRLSINDGHTGKCEGKIKKKFSGVAKELMTSADNFKVSFPNQSTVHDRALLLGSVILCDYLYFEKPPPAEKHEENKKG
mmetsp:Transcript_5219/g.6641  ORF Transcript_5219/g.6641 Transcript_5219/m.6641 type:complete len:274 (-) Transcript_5219:146-967(-)